jgi:hypothetical protein
MNKLKTISDKEMQSIVDCSNSISQILGELNLSKSCSYYRKLLLQRMKELDLKNFEKNQKDNNKFANFYNKYNTEELFHENSKADIKTVKRKYSILFPQERCCICEIPCIWNNKKLNLHLDHINGNNSDNRLENLRWICPNCHSQTPTYTGRNSKRNKN